VMKLLHVAIENVLVVRTLEAGALGKTTKKTTHLRM
jgi:hypothetical protein